MQSVLMEQNLYMNKLHSMITNKKDLQTKLSTKSWECLLLLPRSIFVTVHLVCLKVIQATYGLQCARKVLFIQWLIIFWPMIRVYMYTCILKPVIEKLRSKHKLILVTL